MLDDKRGWLVLVWVVLLNGPEPVRAVQPHPAEVQGLKSPAEDLGSTRLVFVNNNPDKIRLYWLDYEGKRKLYKTLEPGETYEQQTYQAHPWVITDSKDDARDLVFPEPKPRTVEIDFQNLPWTLAALSPDGRMMAFGSRFKGVPLRLYETGSGKSRLAEPLAFPASNHLTFLTSEVLVAATLEGTVRCSRHEPAGS